MATTPKESHQASFLEKLDLIPGVVATVGAALYAAITGPFRGDWGAYTYKQHITHAFLRKYTSRLSTAQLQYVNPSFHDVYEKWCKQHKASPEYVTLPSGCKAFWMGQKTASTVVVYFHGGGFAMDGTASHINFCNLLQNDLQSANKNIAFLFVEYTLVPYATYPAQLREGVEAIQFILQDPSRSPSDIILAGDSAGGNLCIAILSHIMHPVPEVPKLGIEKPLKALIMVAPWVSFDIKQESATRNAYKDIFKPEMGIKWGTDYLGGKESNPYTEALLAPAEWWENAKVEQVLVVAGADEILVDSISLWTEKFKSVNSDILTYVVAKGESHIAPFIEAELGDTTETEHERAIKAWMKSRL